MSIFRFWEELTLKHGKHVLVSDGNRLYEDGTRVTGIDYPLVHEAPQDEIRLARLRKQYLMIKLKEEVNDFEGFKHACLDQARMHAANPRFCSPPPPSAKEQLEAGKTRIMEIRMEIARIDLKLPDRKEQEQKAEVSHERNAAMQSLDRELRSIGLE